MKRQRLSIIFIVFISLIMGMAIFNSKPYEKSKSIDKEHNNKHSIMVVSKKLNNTEDKILKKEAIDVFNNDKNVNLKVELIEDNNGMLSISLSYYRDSMYVTKTIDTKSVPEIRSIFHFRQKQGSGYRISNMLFNKNFGKLYFSVEGKKDKDYYYTSVYSYELENYRIEKLFNDFGIFSSFFISPNGKYNAFYYIEKNQVSPEHSKKLISIIRCDDNKLIINRNNAINEKSRGKNNNLYTYSYEFIKWHSNNICEIREKIKAKDSSQKVKETTVYYNADTNELNNQR